MANHNVWAVLQLRDGQVSRAALETIAAAQKLAAAIGGKAEAVVLGSGVTEAATAAAVRDLAAVHVADHADLAGYTPGAFIGALAPALRAAQPAFVVFAHTYQTVDYAPRLAHEIGAGLLPQITGFTAEGSGVESLLFSRPILGGKLQAKVKVRGEGTVIVSIQSGAFSSDSAATGAAAAPVQPLADPSEIKPEREILGIEEVGGDQIDLTKSEVIVAVGRGIGGADKLGPVEDLAKALGAEIGASRPVIDSGWLPRDRQIGSSGQTVAPKLYLALGISGAIQHLVGMKASTCVVAINKDPGAPIFAVANYGIVADVHEVLPALTAAVKAAKGV